MAENPHITAVLALLEPLTAPVYVTRAPTGSTRHIVLHPSRGLGQNTSLEGDDDYRLCRFMTHCVGVGWEMVDADATRVRDALSRVRPTVTGRKSSPIIHEQELGIDRDDDMPDTVFLARDMWTFSTTPA